MTDPILDDPPTLLEKLRAMQDDATRQMFGHYLPGAPEVLPEPVDLQQWALSGSKLQKMWLDYSAEQMASGSPALTRMFDPAQWTKMVEGWYRQMPLADPQVQKQLWEDGLALWTGVLGQFGIGPAASGEAGEAKLPRSDRRFADPKWREQPAFALIHQTYLMLAEQIVAMADKVDGLDAEQKRAAPLRQPGDRRCAVSPANFPLTNPVVLERTLETQGREPASRGWSTCSPTCARAS